MRYVVYTDGSCSHNPGGTGGIGIVVYLDGKEIYRGSQGYRETTNNRMELRAVVAVMKLYGDRELDVWTDSEYVQKGISEWLPTWKSLGWKKKTRGPIMNLDLWKEIDELVTDNISFQWVKAHADSEENNLADALARDAAVNGPHITDKGFIMPDEKCKA